MFKLFSPLDQFIVFQGLHNLGLDNVFLTFFLLVTGLFFILLQFFNQNRRIYSFNIFLIFADVVSKLLNNTCHPMAGKYFPIYFTIFIFIAFSNLLGLVPFVFTLTAQFSVTFGLALITFGAITLHLITVRKLEFFSLFLPANTPLLISPFLLVIELVSYFTRVISLAVRLFANMIAGHILIKVALSLVTSAMFTKSLVTTNNFDYISDGFFYVTLDTLGVVPASTFEPLSNKVSGTSNTTVEVTEFELDVTSGDTKRIIHHHLQVKFITGLNQSHSGAVSPTFAELDYSLLGNTQAAAFKEFLKTLEAMGSMTVYVLNNLTDYSDVIRRLGYLPIFFGNFFFLVF